MENCGAEYYFQLDEEGIVCRRAKYSIKMKPKFL